MSCRAVCDVVSCGMCYRVWYLAVCVVVRYVLSSVASCGMMFCISVLPVVVWKFHTFTPNNFHLVQFSTTYVDGETVLRLRCFVLR